MDDLVFGIGFDVEGGGEEAIRDWRKLQKRLQGEINRSVLDVKIDLDGKAVSDEIVKIRAEMNRLAKEFDKMPLTQKFDFDMDGSIVGFTEATEKLISRYNKLLIVSETYGKNITQYSRDAKRQLEQELKATERLNKEKDKMLKKAGMDAATSKETSEYSRQIQLLRTKVQILNGEERSLNQINAKLQIQKERLKGLNIDSQKFTQVNAEVQRLTKKLQEVQSRISGINRASNQSAIAQNAERANRAYARQLTYVERLIERATVYGAIFAAGRFVSRIREVTAEFELQRVSLAAMLQSAEQADTLFQKTVQAAIQSPFEIKDLIAYTKQLAAYGVQYDKLFDTTQRLADIAAGLGADFGRLALAYGQIRARGFLAGTELKQLTELGLAFPEMLAEELTKVRGMAISVSDVFDMISKREITFGDVENVFEKLTSDGGRFYNMQQKQAATLAGQWSNLQDVISTVFNDIGQENYEIIAGMIGAVKSGIQDWRDWAAVLESVIVLWGTYKVLNASILTTEKALSVVQAGRLAITKQQSTLSARLLKHLIGETAAKKVNTAVTRAHTAALIRQSVATNVLEKSVWRLWAALLANPYAAIAAVIGGVAVALYQFNRNAQDATVKIERLNETVGQLKQTTVVANMIDSYEKLRDKANKTNVEMEQMKRLSEDLSKQFPMAAEGVDEMTNSLIINTEKAREYNNKLKDILTRDKEENVQSLTEQRTEIQKEIDKLIAEYDRYASFLDEGDGYWARGRKMAAEHEMPILAKQIKGLLKDLEEIDSALKGLNEKPSPSGTESPLNAWQKVFEATGKYDKEVLQNLSTLPKALEDVASKYKDAAKQVETYNKAVKSKQTSEEEKKNIQGFLDTLTKDKQVYYDLLKRYDALNLLEEGKGAKNAAKERLDRLKDEVKLVQDIYKRYKEYNKYMNSAEAQTKTQDVFKKAIEELSFGAAYTPGQLTEILNKYKDEIESLDPTEGIKLTFTIDDVTFSEVERRLKEGLDKVKMRIEQQQRRDSFLQSIIGATGNVTLANTLAESLFGSAQDLAESYKEQVRIAFGGASMSKSLSDSVEKALSGAKIDYKALQSLIPDLPKAFQQAASGIVSEGLNLDIDEILDLTKGLAKYKTYEQRKTEIKLKGEEERAKIAKQFGDSEAGQQYMAASLKSEEEAIKDVNVEMFKSSEDYIKVFSNLERASTASIRRMIAELKKFLAANQAAMSSQEIKDFMQAWENLENELTTRNPFGSIIASLKEWQRINKDISLTDEEREEALRGVSADMRTAIGQIGQYGAQIQELTGGVRDIMEMFGASDEVMDYFDGITTGLNEVAGASQDVLNSALSFATGDIFGGILNLANGAVKLFKGLVSIFSVGRIAKSNKEIRKQQELLEQLQDTYKRLEKDAEKVLGTDLIENYNERYANLMRQASAAWAKAEAEKNKGLVKDKKKVEQYMDEYEQLLEEARDLNENFVEELFGLNLSGYAKQLASIWLEARLAGENTFNALRQNWKETMRDMIANTLLAQAVQRMLEPVFEYLDSLKYDSGLLNDPAWWAELDRLMTGTLGETDKVLEGLMQMFEKYGINIGGKADELQGIAKDVATASEESILGLAAGINTQNYYISYVPSIKEDTSMIVTLLRGGALSGISQQGIDVAATLQLQNSYLSNLPNISKNTADTVQECKRMVVLMQGMYDRMNQVIKPAGSPTGSHTVKISY